MSFTKEETERINFATPYLEKWDRFIPDNVFGYVHLDEDVMRFLWFIYDCKKAVRNIYYTVLKKIHPKKAIDTVRQ